MIVHQARLSSTNLSGPQPDPAGPAQDGTVKAEVIPPSSGKAAPVNDDRRDPRPHSPPCLPGREV